MIYDSALLKNFQPMLAKHVYEYAEKKKGMLDDDPTLNGLHWAFKDKYFPLFCSPKLDGIRISILPDLGPRTRTLKGIPNQYITAQINRWPQLVGLDAEIVCSDPLDPASFNKTQSIVMTGSPSDVVTPFTLVVFDWFLDPMMPYHLRMQQALKQIRLFNDSRDLDPSGNKLHWQVHFVDTVHLAQVQEVIDFEEECIQKGYEGIMLRSNAFFSGYKFGRVTPKQFALMKIKRMIDAEGIIVGAEEKLTNNNEAMIDERGYTKRSSHQANLIPANTLGVLQVKVLNGTFKDRIVGVGSGFDDETRKKLWTEWLNGSDAPGGGLLGKTITFKYQPHGSKDKPRIPIFKGFRNE